MKFHLLFFWLLCLFALATPVRAEPAGTAIIVPIAPSACPPAGCAAGQRLSYRLEYEVGSYDTKAAQPNVKVCVYVPLSWVDAASMTLSAKGGISGVDYALAADCTAEDLTPPDGYGLVAAAAAGMNKNFFQDTLDLNFRINKSASGTGTILLRVFEYNQAGTWVRTSQMFTTQLQVVPSAATAYVASAPAACVNSPCYLNSAGDGPNGVGTGLRDAIEAAQPGGTIVILGSALVKNSAVLVDQPINLLGIDGGGTVALEAGATCAGDVALLKFSNGGSLRGLKVNANGCSGLGGRRLVEVNSSQPVLIEANTLENATDAIYVKGNAGALTVRFNQINGSSAHALYWDNATSAAGMTLVANNIGGAVECAAGGSGANRLADHNYWGSANAPDPAATHCSIAAGKQLGAPIALAANGAGVAAQLVTVGQAKTAAFGGLISYKRTGGAADFGMYVVNHGNNLPESIPFPGIYSMPNLCSNVWDVFLAEGVSSDAELDLYIRYNLTTACKAAVEIPTFCGQTSSIANYPLWWYDPRGLITLGWDTAGQNPAGPSAAGATGQTTSCSTADSEIMVQIDGSGRPGLGEDMSFTPFLVGIPVTNTFAALASDKAVTLNWTTVSEPDVTGYYVMRSSAKTGPFEAVSELIARRGSAIAGNTYSHTDSALTNGLTYYYRLKLARSDGGYTFSDVVTIIPNVATATPTPTVTRTPTITVTPTPTKTRTPFPTSTPFRSPTAYVPPATRASSLTPTRYVSPTNARTTPQATPGRGTPSAQPTLSGTDSGYPGPGQTPDQYPYPGADLTNTPTSSKPQPGSTANRTPQANTTKGTATLARSLVPTLSYAEQVRNSSRYVSLMLGLLLGGGIFAGVAWLIFFRKRPAG